MPLYAPENYPLLGPGTPYITPTMLVSAATGIQWSTIGGYGNTRVSAEGQLAEQTNICARSTSILNGYLNQPLHATIDTEQLTGPGDFRCQIQPNGRARLLLSRSPVTAVLSGQVTGADAFPAQWTAIPANQFRIERPVIGIYGTTSPGGSGDGGQSVVLSPGWISWAFGRLSSDIQVTYINGWPHASLTAPTAAAATTIAVDDCTGWGPPAGLSSGAVGTIYDGQLQESVTCLSASATSGPGTLTLARALQYAHGYGALVSSMPASVQQAAILVAVSQALIRGATATTVQAVPGSSVGPGAQPKDFLDAGVRLIHTYRRVI